MWRRLKSCLPDLSGVNVVVTAGGTREPIDPIRFLGNRSSGKMGNAFAAAALEAGASVTLITAASPPLKSPQMKVVQVETADEMAAAVQVALSPGSVLVMAAAVADYKPASVASEKIKKTGTATSLELVPTIDILVTVGHSEMRDQLFIVGFAAETENLLENAQKKIATKRLDLCVVNDVSSPDVGMGADENAVTICDRAGLVAEFGRAPKGEIATAIIGLVAARLASR